MVSSIERESGLNVTSLPQLLLKNASRLGNRACMREKHRGIWRQWSWQQVLEGVRALAAAFQLRGVKQGDRIAIVGENRPRLYWAMSAAQWLGSVPVLLAADTPADVLARVLAERQVSVVVVDGSGQFEKLLQAGGAVRIRLRDVIVDNPFGLQAGDTLSFSVMDDLIAAGEQVDPATQAALDRTLSLRRLENCVADLPFSDITLGSPRDAWSQTQSTIISHADAIEFAGQDSKAYDVNAKDDLVAYLPFGSWADLYSSHILPLLAGATVNFPEAADTLAVDIREIGPTVHFIPDWAIEKLRKATLARAKGSRRERLAKLIDACRVRRNPLTLVLRVCYLWPLRDVLGFSRTRIVFTFGSPKSEAIDFLTALGIRTDQSRGLGARKIATSALGSGLCIATSAKSAVS
ncbi:AMP-binding protein [Bradyrhizobium cenepequi]